MIFFPNSMIQFYGVTESLLKNDFGEALEELSPLSLMMPADVQPASAAELDEEFGEIKTDTYIVYTNPFSAANLDVQFVRINESWFEIIGGILENRHLGATDHNELYIHKIRKPLYSVRPDIIEKIQDYLYLKTYNDDEIDYDYANAYFTDK